MKKMQPCKPWQRCLNMIRQQHLCVFCMGLNLGHHEDLPLNFLCVHQKYANAWDVKSTPPEAGATADFRHSSLGIIVTCKSCLIALDGLMDLGRVDFTEDCAKVFFKQQGDAFKCPSCFVHEMKQLGAFRWQCQKCGGEWDQHCATGLVLPHGFMTSCSMMCDL